MTKQQRKSRKRALAIAKKITKKPKTKKTFAAESKLKAVKKTVKNSVGAIDSLCKTIDDVVPPDVQEAATSSVQGWIGGITGMGVGLLMKGKKTLCGRASVMSKSY